MKVTIKDIAREANVSIATVSRVINGKDKVKKETKLKILKAIEKYNYSPDQIARTMIMNETKSIGLIVPFLPNEYWGNLAEIIQDTLWERGYSLVIGSHNEDQMKLHSILKTFKERKVDGVILTTSLNDTNLKQIKQMERSGIKFISLVPMDEVNSVHGDDFKGAMEGVNHLIKLGHKKIVYIGAKNIISSEREMGYKNALLMDNTKIDKTLIVTDEFSSNFSEIGYNAITKIIENGIDFTAVFCVNDLIAIGAIKALHEKGIEVPEKTAVVGFDDISIADLYRPSLTTIRQPYKDMGETAVEQLINLIKNNDQSNAKKLVFPMKLIIRESCGYTSF